MFTMKKALATGMVIASLAIGIGVVGAQDGNGRPGGFGGRAGGPGGRGPGEIVQLVADATGLDAQELLSQLRDGATLSDLITANGGDVEAVKAQVIAEATAKLSQAVTDGKITQAQADEALQGLNDHIDGVFSGTEVLGHGHFGEGVLQVIETAAAQLDLTVDELRAELQSGKTLADVLTEHNVDQAAFSEAIVTAATAQANQAVTDGKLTQDQADRLLSGLQDRLSNGLDNLFMGPPHDGGKMGV